MKKITAFSIGLIAGALIGSTSSHRCSGNKDGEAQVDTLFIHDTLTYTELGPVHDTITHYIKGKPVHDTLRLDPETIYASGDSVIIPISQKEYTDDSTFRAWISGYKAHLDSINIFRKSVVITRHEQSKPTSLSINIGTGVGYGLTTGKPDIYIGVTAGWNIWSLKKRTRSDRPPDWGR